MTTKTPDFQQWAATQQSRIEAQLQAVLPAADIAPQRLHAAMRYAALGGGKRVRPLLAFAAGEVVVEASTGPKQVEELLAAASGSRGMAGGQAIDLAATGKTLTLPELEFMHIHKTGAIIRATTLLGARCGTPLEKKELERLDHFAKCIGLAFQVVDDVLDIEASTATLGKTAGKDAQHNKPTYVSLIGVAESKKLAGELRADALASLEVFGARALRLRELADFIVLRKF